MMTLFRRALVGVMVTGVVAFGAPQTHASAATRATEQFATAVWTLTDGCVETRIVVYSSESAGAPENFFYLSQTQTCDDPNVVQPVLDLTGQFTGGQLLVSSNLRSGRLVATGPVACSAYVAGACDQDPYNADLVSLQLTWTLTGPIGTTTSDGVTCRYRYGQATGSILLGDVNLLADDDGTVLSDPTETDVGLCVTSQERPNS
jgi:Tfp pilus assembly protein PilV